MADGSVYLDELNTNSHSYKVKVKVVHKGKPIKSAADVLYQTVVLQDDKGHKRRGMLFGDQIAGHTDALMYNGVYEIANAPIKPLPDQYRRDPAEMAYTMGFGRQTLIRPLASTPGAFLPDYRSISQVPKTATIYDIFASRDIPSKQGRTNTVREVILTDHSTDQPVVVSVWNDLAGSVYDKLYSLVDTLPVLGFTALRVSTHRGFSLTGTMSTLIEMSPKRAKTDALLEWNSRNKEFLSGLQARINRARDPNAPIDVLTLSVLKAKKAKHTLQDERYHLNVLVPVSEFQKINAYVGCSHCGKRSDYAAGDHFKCETCTKDGVMAEPRVTFNCKISDSTDQLEITSFTEDTVKLFQMSAADLFHMKHTNDKMTFGRVQASLKNEPFTIEVSPKTDLSRNNILQWALRKVVTAPGYAAGAPAVPHAADTEQEIVVGTTKQAAPVARQLDFGAALEHTDNLALVEVAVSADHPSLRKLPASIITAPEVIQLQKLTAQKITEQSHAAVPVTTQADILDTIPPSIVTMSTTPLLKMPKVEKDAACTPETPAQGTPKRTTAKQAVGSPPKKKKAATSSDAGH